MLPAKLSACLLLVALAGCNHQQSENTMSSSFHPPGIGSLADIDIAEVTYGQDFVELEGVLSPRGQGGWPGQNDGYKVHSFVFSAWQRLGAPVVKRELVVLRPVPPDYDYWEDFPKLSLQRIRVLLSSDETRAVFGSVLPMETPNSELQAIAEELKKPVIVATEEFGDLELDRTIDWFEAKAKWNGETIRVTFPNEQDRPNASALETAEKVWSQQAVWKQRVEALAVKELLRMKNETWLDTDAGETELSAEQFLARMKLNSIYFNEAGDFEFCYDDGDLFWGHEIVVRCTLKEGPIEAGIQG